MINRAFNIVMKMLFSLLLWHWEFWEIWTPTPICSSINVQIQKPSWKKSRQKHFLLLKIFTVKGGCRNTISVKTCSCCRLVINKKRNNCKFFFKLLYFKISKLIFYSTVHFRVSFSFIYLKSLKILKWKWNIYFQSKKDWHFWQELRGSQFYTRLIPLTSVNLHI